MSLRIEGGPIESFNGTHRVHSAVKRGKTVA